MPLPRLLTLENTRNSLRLVKLLILSYEAIFHLERVINKHKNRHCFFRTPSGWYKRHYNPQRSCYGQQWDGHWSDIGHRPGFLQWQCNWWLLSGYASDANSFKIYIVLKSIWIHNYARWNLSPLAEKSSPEMSSSTMKKVLKKSSWEMEAIYVSNKLY